MMKKETWSLPSNFSWCVDNDFQVYVEPEFMYTISRTVSRKFVVVVRRGGITTCGLDRKQVGNTIYESKALRGSIIYKTQREAEESLPALYEKLRKRYG
jgi:hypothetical protein